MKNLDLGQNYALVNLLKFAEEVVTEEGNRYYRFPYWFQLHPGNFEFTIHFDEPGDLSDFICKALMGNNHPQPKLAPFINQEKEIE